MDTQMNRVIKCGVCGKELDKRDDSRYYIDFRSFRDEAWDVIPYCHLCFECGSMVEDLLGALKKNAKRRQKIC